MFGLSESKRKIPAAFIRCILPQNVKKYKILRDVSELFLLMKQSDTGNAIVKEYFSSQSYHTLLNYDVIYINGDKIVLDTL